MSELLRVGQVAEKLGISPQTLYFYERLGLIPKPRRTEGATASTEKLSWSG